MSGPKYSRPRLTPEQKARLQEQARLRREKQLKEKRIEKALNHLAEQRNDADHVIISMSEELKRFETLCSETGRKNTQAVIAQNKKEEVMQFVRNSVRLTSESDEEQIRESSRSLELKTRELVRAERKLQQAYKEEKDQFQAENTQKMQKAFEISFAEFGMKDEAPISDKTEAEKLRVKKAKIFHNLSELDEIHISSSQKKKLLNIRNEAEAISNTSFLSNYNVITVLPFIKECRSYDDFYRNNMENYRNLLDQYCLLAEQLELKEEDISFTPDAIQLLQKKCSELESALEKKNEQEYISQSVDQVMEEMGYHMVGSRNVTKKSGRKIRNELYLLEEGTAVNVTFAVNGQITMELGGLDHADRLPTPKETESLIMDMRSFCEDYRQIEQKLREKGILLDTIQHLPPDGQAAQIINMDDYIMNSDVGTYEAKDQRRGMQETLNTRYLD